MRIREVRSTEFGKELRKDNVDFAKLLESFRRSNAEIVAVENEDNYYNNNDMRKAIKDYMNRKNVQDLDCFMLNGNVYLTKAK